MQDYFLFLVCWDASCWTVKYPPIFKSHLEIRGLQVPVQNHLNQFFSAKYLAYWQKVADNIFCKYKDEYEQRGLPKGYTTVSMIWGGILLGGCKGTTGIVNFFIQCAEDNALCTLVEHVNDKNLKCQKVSWYAFSCQNKCQRKECKDSNCPKKKCEKCECYKKPLCPFCKVGFKNRIIENLHIDKSQLYIDDKNVSDDLDEGNIDYVNLSF